MRIPSAAILTVLLVPSLAWAGVKDKDNDGPTSAGTIDVRGGINLDLDKTINLGGDSDGSEIGGGINVGVGYFVIDNLAIDNEVRVTFQFAPKFDVTRLEWIPGLRFHPLPQFFVRVGTPVVVIPEFGFGVLAGAGYRQPLGKKAAFVIQVDYTYWLTEFYRQAAPNGQLQVSAGVQTSF